MDKTDHAIRRVILRKLISRLRMAGGGRHSYCDESEERGVHSGGLKLFDGMSRQTPVPKTKAGMIVNYL
jgi:hypothetical protein